MLGEQLVFMISQPRSGSTLMQKVLGSNEDIYTRSEPWVMLHPAYALKQSGVVAEYNRNLERGAVSEFFAGLPGNEDSYIKKVSEIYGHMYQTYLDSNDKKIFLDKTPRYSLIINELIKIYPKAKQVIIIRDPLSVLSSLVPRKYNWEYLSENKIDLIHALDNILNVVINPGDNQYVVKYEDFICDPETECKKLCDFIGVAYSVEMLTGYLDKTPEWIYGDKKIYGHDGIDRSKVRSWLDNLEDPQHWRVLYDYLRLLGEKKYNELGYDFNESKKLLNDNCPFDTIKEVLTETSGLDVLVGKDDRCMLDNKCKSGLYSKEYIEIEDQLKMQKEQLKMQKEQVALYKATFSSLNDYLSVRYLVNPIKKYKRYKRLLQACKRIG